LPIKEHFSFQNIRTSEIKEHFYFQIYGHGLGLDCWKIYEDPIYDTDGDVSSENSDDLLTYEQPNSLEGNAELLPLEQPSLISAYSETSVTNFQPCIAICYAENFQRNLFMQKIFKGT
jgi:hypothetical protein